MKVLFIIPEEFNGERWGGVTTYVVELSQALQKLGYEICVLTPGEKNQSYKKFNVLFCKVPHEWPTGNVFGFLYKILDRISPDILERVLWARDVKRYIYSHGPFDVIEAPEWGSSTLLLPFHKGIVVRLHKSWMMYKKDNRLPIGVVDYITDVFERWCILTASGVSSPTKYMLSQYMFIKWFLTVRQTPIRVIPNGLVIKAKNKARCAAQQYILTVGRVEVGKGALVLIDAWRQILNTYPKISLIIVGEDTHMYIKGKWTSCIQYLKQLIKAKQHTRVHFVSRQNRERLRRYYECCLFYVAPSLGHENFPITVLEAMETGKAIIGSSTGGIPEVLRHGHNGLLFATGSKEDLVDKMEYMITHADFRRACEICARATYEKYDIMKIAKQTKRFYSSL